MQTSNSQRGSGLRPYKFTLAVATLIVAANTHNVLAASGSGSTMLRTPDGQPDLTGYWSLSAMRFNANLANEGEDKVPYTAAGREAFLQRDHKKDPTGFCQPPGWPRMAHSPFPMKIMQEKNSVVFLYEYSRIWRQVDLNRTRHYPDVEDTFFGDSIGHWEGNTLVIDTTGLTDRTWLDSAGHQHTADMRVIERLTRNGPEALDYEIEIRDPAYYSRPWIHKGTLTPQRKTDGLPELLEYFCNDNNIDMEHLATPGSKPD